MYRLDEGVYSVRWCINWMGVYRVCWCIDWMRVYRVDVGV